MPDDLLFAISHTVGNQSFLQHTSQLHDYLQLTDLILLQEGILPLDLALDGMCAFLEDTRTINPNLCIRLLKITYDYAHLDGQTVLIHPGLYDPMPFAGKLPDYPRSIYDIDADAALGFWDAITETAQLLEGLISHSLRKDCYAPDISGDIVLLCRQGAPFEALVDALRSCLVREPTESMLDMLRLLRAQIPAWSALRDAHLFQGGLVC